MEEVSVRPVDLQMLAAAIPLERAELLLEAAERARIAFGDRLVWHVNATAHGGGVAEMLQTLLGYATGAKIDNRWLVLDGDPEFFAITKRLHNMLHGNVGDAGALGPQERAHYERVMSVNLADLLHRVSPGDLVVLHDPQTAGLAPGLHGVAGAIVWRCHVGRDSPDDVTAAAWGFLRPYLEHADSLIFSRREYAPDWVEETRLAVIPPSIDPLAVKNTQLAPDQCAAILVRVGLLTGSTDGPPSFTRSDGSEGVVRNHAKSGGVLINGAPPPPDVPMVLQVSRWDRLKDMAGVMSGFVRAVEDDRLGRAHLVLAGPELSGVTDDPEGAEVLAECREQWSRLPEQLRDRVHLAVLPMDDSDENAIIVNALQRHAAVVVQKSLEEGFGLTVSEAMWKSRPVVATRIGGIQDQITDDRDGLLLDDPRDIDEFATALDLLINDPELAARLGAAAHLRVLDQFVTDRHLRQYVELLSSLVRGPVA